MRWIYALAALVAFIVCLPAQESFPNGDAFDLDEVIPANERGIVALAEGNDGRIYGGTTGRAAHLFAFDPAKEKAQSLLRLPGGIGLAYGLIALPDGSFLTGTQADPTRTAVKTDPKQVGKILRVFPNGKGSAKVEELGIPVPGQGVYTLAFDPATQTLVGNTWPDGHFFSYSLTTKKFQDHGAIAGYRTFETPRHADDLNKHITPKHKYPRQVARSIVVVPGIGAFTTGKEGVFHHFDFAKGKLTPLKLRLPATPGREPWASLDAAAVFPARGKQPASILGGSSDGYLFELRIPSLAELDLRSRGRGLAQPFIQALAPLPSGADGEGTGVIAIGGSPDGMPRFFRFSRGGGSSSILPGPVPSVDGTASSAGFGAMLTTKAGKLYAGESDRIGRLVRFDDAPKKKLPRKAKSPTLGKTDAPPKDEKLTPLKGWVAFAPPGTTTDGSGYTAISVGQDGKVYVGSARYGGYAYLLRFDPKTKTSFMEKVVNMRQLCLENLEGIFTQGKIHALIIVGPDGRIWFATKQAHEIFGTRPEYGESDTRYPGGHLCYFDPKTGFSRSVGILKRHEGLMAGAMDKKRNILYYRSEPRNFFLAYDVDKGEVRDVGHQGAQCRYMAIDKDGAVYSPGRGDFLTRYDPETGYMEELAVKLEGEGDYQAPYVIQLGPNGKLYGAGINHPWILEYDIASYKKGQFPSVTVRNVAPAAPPGMPVFDIHAGIFGKDGRFYYPLVTQGPTLTGKSDRHLRIMRFDPATRKSETVGLPDLNVDEAKVKHAYNRGEKYMMDHIQGMAVSADGSLHVMDIYPQLNVVTFPKLTAPK